MACEHGVRPAGRTPRRGIPILHAIRNRLRSCISSRSLRSPPPDLCVSAFKIPLFRYTPGGLRGRPSPKLPRPLRELCSLSVCKRTHSALFAFPLRLA